MRPVLTALLLLAPIWLAGCDQLGIESVSATAARRDAEGKAIGAGCRHSARSVEECYAQNKRADKAAVFTGWKEMSEYMAENKIEAASPTEPVATTVAEAAAEASEADAKKPAKAGPKKH